MTTALHVASLLLCATLLTTPAHADTVDCSGRMGHVSIDGDLRVPSGKPCTLDGTRIEGNVVVGRAATLSARGVRIEGKLQAEDARQISMVASSRVGDNIPLERSGAVRLDSVTVGGDVQLFANHGALRIAHNRVDGNLQCKSNQRRPTGGGNRVRGNKEDQCARL